MRRLVLVLSTWAAVAAAAPVQFRGKPTATRVGDKVRIAFAVSAPTDVEVAVLDARGKVVRHLAAGLLGKNAPDPLEKDSLAQAILWDGKDDLGAHARGGPFAVRVRIGSAARLEKHVGWDGNTLESRIVGLTVGAKGEVFALFASGHGRSSLRVFDREGKYVRTIIPYAANTPKERLESIGQLEMEGERLPIVFNSHGGNLLPLVAGMKPQTMVFSPKGHLLLASAVGTISSHRPPRYLLAVHPEGGAPKDVGFIGPQIRGLADRGIGFLGGAGEQSSRWLTSLATSPDGETIYLTDSGRSWAYKLPHCIYRLKWSERTPGSPRRGKAYRDVGPDDLGKPFLGKLRQPGDDDEHFNDPQGLAVDRAGRLYVCDHGNGRVMVFDGKGTLLGKWPVEKPEQIAVHPKIGVVYVLSREGLVRRSKFAPALRKFAAFEQGKTPEVLAELKSTIHLMALDPSADPPKLWAYTGHLAPITDAGRSFTVGEPVDNYNGVSNPGFVTGDPGRNRVLYREMLTGMSWKPIRTIDLATGKKTPFLKGTDTALDRHGNILVMGWYGTNALFRYDPAGKPLPFQATGSHKLDTGVWSSYGPDIGLRGHCVALNGDIYLLRSNKWPGGVVNRVDVFGPDGAPKKRDLIDGLQAGDCGIGVDAAGNVYVGVNVKPKDQPLAKPFAGNVPADPWDWWRFDRQGPREVPWCYPYQNTYLDHMGSVLKFGPAGGKLYGLATKPKAEKGKPEPPTPALADAGNAPAGAATFWSGSLKKEARVAGALWRYGGVGPIPASDFGWGDPGCICWNSRLAVDLYGRVFAPNVFRFCVDMLDTNGNRIARIGRYGNSDSAGPGSPVPEPAIAFAWPAYVDAAGGKIFVSDPSNRRITVVRLEWQAEATRIIE